MNLNIYEHRQKNSKIAETLFCLIFFLSTASFAQNVEEIKSKEIALITEKSRLNF